MSRKRNIGLLCGILMLLLLLGCTNGAVNDPDGPNGEENTQDIGTLTVYAPERYRAALQQVFSHINLSQTKFRVSWSSNFTAADIVITDKLPTGSYGDYRALQPERLQVQGIEQLTVRSDGGVIGLPLFLRLDSFWYDELLYKNHGIAVPQSMDSWRVCALNEQYPIVCGETDMGALFWSVVAPYYLKSGGSAEQLSEGVFQRESLLNALKKLENLRDSGMISLSEQAWQSFSTEQAAFWITGVDNIAARYNYMSTRSSWKPSFSLAFDKQERPICVVRADVLAVRKDADTALTDDFLALFLDQQMLADLSAYSKMPLACRMSYAPGTVPELPQVCYTLLSSPTLDVVQVPCKWSADKQQQVCTSLLRLMNGSMDAAQAAEGMLQ